jgi:hypothetical protein
MPETIQRLALRLYEEGQKTAAFFGALDPQQLDQQLYADGTQWAVRHLLAHFVTAERGIYTLLEIILAGGQGVAPDFDIDAYNERHVAALRQASFDELLERFLEQRQASIALVQRMLPEDLERMGRHPYLGIASVEDILKLIYRHNQIHQRDVRKLLAAEGDKG